MDDLFSEEEREREIQEMTKREEEERMQREAQEMKKK